MLRESSITLPELARDARSFRDDRLLRYRWSVWVGADYIRKGE